ncbi:hypothetical protein MSG28_011282 [Choristoneura fumiferana]|uniref:Uncharacterized protein n=1 Tax=Choristoneura fumiferana TaxID=7141 RepID=A0ACC0KS13_CHOFU|nr:hypothetical protein MSG28_011282 [Choristoneura fumiferana]
MCCSWLRWRRRVASVSAESDGPIEAFVAESPKQLPSETESATEQHELQPPPATRATRNNQVRTSVAPGYTNGHGGDTTGRRGAENVPPAPAPAPNPTPNPTRVTQQPPASGGRARAGATPSAASVLPAHLPYMPRNARNNKEVPDSHISFSISFRDTCFSRVNCSAGATKVPKLYNSFTVLCS